MVVFDAVMWVAIAISSILMAFDTPLADSLSTRSLTLYWIDLGMTCLFSIELVVKVIAFGILLNGTKSYLL